MSDWSLPTVNDLYTDVLSYISSRLDDAAAMFYTTPTNQPTHAIRYNRSTNLFEEWNGSAWVAKTIAVAGGGTGGATAAAARTALGLGTLAVQDSNNVSITAGSVASSALSGLVPQANLGSGSGGAGTKVLYDDQTYKTPGVIYTFLSKSANYTITSSDLASPLCVVCITNAFTITLPAASSVDGRFTVLKNAQTVNSITVNPNGADTIDGAASITIPPGAAGRYFAFTLLANSARSEWELI